MKDFIKGDSNNFNSNWKHRPESGYLHWTNDEPTNQVQLAFRRHWMTFSKILNDLNIPVGKSLEVGCGRGSLSAYFSENGWDTTLLDTSSTVIKKAKEAFSNCNLPATFIEGNCLDMSFNSNTFDCVFSIGLFEHFENIIPVAKEQFRVLRPGGIVFAYVVPQKEILVQKDFDWINKILANEIDSNTTASQKAPIYRSDFKSSFYCNVFKDIGFSQINTSGIYSMPMISNSTDFPFTLLKKDSELELVSFLTNHLNMLKSSDYDDSWLCPEDYGHAFLVWAIK